MEVVGERPVLNAGSRPAVLQLLPGPQHGESAAAFLRTTSEDLETDAVRVTLQLAFLASQAYEMVHAITVTLVRLGITKHGLLVW